MRKETQLHTVTTELHQSMNRLAEMSPMGIIGQDGNRFRIRMPRSSETELPKVERVGKLMGKANEVRGFAGGPRLALLAAKAALLRSAELPLQSRELRVKTS